MPAALDDRDTNPLTTQLASLGEILEAEGIDYWADSGTLLGLVREGQPMPHDDDIDIAVWEKDSDALLAAKPRLERHGYHVRVARYRGQIYGLGCTPNDPQGTKVSIGVHFHHDDHAWRIATYYLDNPHPRWSLRFLLAGLIRFPVRRTAQFLSRRGCDKHWLVNAWPFRKITKMGTWWIPARYLRKRKRHPETGVMILSSPEEYLDARYGDWQTPQSDWVWYEDDGLAWTRPPEEVAEQHEPRRDPEESPMPRSPSA